MMRMVTEAGIMRVSGTTEAEEVAKDLKLLEYVLIHRNRFPGRKSKIQRSHFSRPDLRHGFSYVRTPATKVII